MMNQSEVVTCDANNLQAAFLKTIKSSSNKLTTQKFMQHELDEIKKAQDELHNRTWKIESTSPFIINERGHIRKIQGNTPYDRMIIHSYIDNVLQPLLSKHFIYDNYASQDGKGTSLARKRFENFLHQAYRKYGNNQFYVGLADMSKFYDNIQHEKLKQAIFKYVPYDEFHDYMLTTILDSFVVDVSYMTEDEYAHCLDIKYIALDHIFDVPKGEKFMHKSINIGNQGSQIFSIFYPTQIDNYCKIVKGLKFYGRYMDDMFFISDDKNQIHNIISDIKTLCDEMGLYLNEKKTQIHKVNQNFKFLNRIYRMTDSGHLQVKLSNSTYNRERKKLKKFKVLLDDGKMPIDRIENQFKSWLGGNIKYINKTQLNQIKDLYNNLFGGIRDNV